MKERGQGPVALFLTTVSPSQSSDMKDHGAKFNKVGSAMCVFEDGEGAVKEK